MRAALLAFCLGLLGLSFARHEQDIPYVIILCLVSLPFLLLLISIGLRKNNTRSKVLQLASTLVLAFVLGMLWHGLWAQGKIQDRLPVELEGVDMLVEGFVSNLPQQNQISQQFEFQITNSDSNFSDRKVLLNYYGKGIIEPGQKWQMLVRLNRPHGFANPGGFDYEAWLFQKNISAKGYVRSSFTAELLHRSRLSCLRDWQLSLSMCSASLNLIRFRIKQLIVEAVGDSRYAGVLLALSLGDGAEINGSDWQLLADTGTNHLFVISGLHIGMIAGFCFLLARRALRLFPGVGLYVPQQKLAAVLAIVAALLYSLLAGFTLATQRALVMIVVYMLGFLLSRNILVSFRFLLALACVLALNPLSALNPGFWYSFIAVGALLMCVESAQVKNNAVDGALDHAGGKLFFSKCYDYFIKPQLIVFLALLIPLAIWTQQITLLSPLVNVFAIPLIGFCVVPLCLLGLIATGMSVRITEFCFSLADALLSYLFNFLQSMVGHAGFWALIPVPALQPMQITAALFVVFLLLAPKSVLGRGRGSVLVIPFILAVMFPQSIKPIAEDVRVHVLDVGQGLSVIVQTKNHALVYDTGANLSAEFNIGEAVLVPVLRDLGIKSLNKVIISHGDNDHAGGLSGLAAAIPIEVLHSSSEELGVDLAIRSCNENQSWDWDGVYFHFLSNEQEFASANNNSCVLRIGFSSSAEEGAVLLPGDIESAAEKTLVLKYGAQLRSSLLLAPHHGSSTSSSYVFLKNVEPEQVVYASGYRNSFDHPNEKVTARYDEFSAKSFSTAVSGTISFNFSFSFSFSFSRGQVLSRPRLFREEEPHYWY